MPEKGLCECPLSFRDLIGWIQRAWCFCGEERFSAAYEDWKRAREELYRLESCLDKPLPNSKKLLHQVESDILSHDKDGCLEKLWELTSTIIEEACGIRWP